MSSPEEHAQHTNLGRSHHDHTEAVHERIFSAVARHDHVYFLSALTGRMVLLQAKLNWFRGLECGLSEDVAPVSAKNP